MIHEDTLNWANRQLEIIVKKFTDQRNMPVYFNDFDIMGIGTEINIPEANNISKGGYLSFKINGNKEKVANYIMYKDAFMPLHHHPDMVERFEIHRGIMVNQVTNKMYKKGDIFDVAPYVPHKYICLEDAEMTISMYKLTR